MRSSIIPIFKPIALGIAVMATMLLGQGIAKSEEVFISGYTNGCFNGNVAGGCVAGDPANSSAVQTATLLGLQYVNSTFSGTTVNGFRAVGGNPMAPPTQNVNNLGAFSLANSEATYNGNTFELRVTFTAPQGIAGSATTLISAVLVGQVNSLGNGGVFIDFNNTPMVFTFNDTNCENGPADLTRCGAGSFTFAVNDLSIDPGQVTSITGQITSAQQTAVPEPASMLLLGTGLAGVARAVRRKVKARNEA